jgi:hypothetical protein
MIPHPSESSREEAQKAQKRRAPFLRFLRLLAASSLRPFFGKSAKAAALDRGNGVTSQYLTIGATSELTISRWLRRI